jgi:AGCS family alanine or glycine:cation symporter
VLIPFGAIARVDVVWAWGDLMNALQIFPNLVGILALSGLVAAVSRAPRAIHSGDRAGRPGQKA